MDFRCLFDITEAITGAPDELFRQTAVRDAQPTLLDEKFKGSQTGNVS